MDWARKLVFQRGIDLAVALNRAFALERFGDYNDSIMRFACFAAQMVSRAGMARMFRRFVFDDNTRVRKSLHQLLTDRFFDCHFHLDKAKIAGNLFELNLRTVNLPSVKPL